MERSVYIGLLWLFVGVKNIAVFYKQRDCHASKGFIGNKFNMKVVLQSFSCPYSCKYLYFPFLPYSKMRRKPWEIPDRKPIKGTFKVIKEVRENPKVMD